MAEKDEKVTLTCVTIETKLAITSITWNAVVDQTATSDLTSVDGTNTGYKVFTSILTITGTNKVQSAEYICTVNMPDDTSYTITSDEGTNYHTGNSYNVTVTGYEGSYIESDQSEGDYSEQFVVTFDIFKGSNGLASFTGKFTKASDGTEAAVTFVAGTEVDGIIPYTYTPDYSLQATGTFSFSSVYQGYSSKTFTSTQVSRFQIICNLAISLLVLLKVLYPALKYILSISVLLLDVL